MKLRDAPITAEISPAKRTSLFLNQNDSCSWRLVEKILENLPIASLGNSERAIMKRAKSITILTPIGTQLNTETSPTRRNTPAQKRNGLKRTPVEARL